MGYIVVPCFIAVFYGRRKKRTKYNKEHLLFLMQKLKYPDVTKKVDTAIKKNYWWHENKNAPSVFCFVFFQKLWYRKDFVAHAFSRDFFMKLLLKYPVLEEILWKRRGMKIWILLQKITSSELFLTHFVFCIAEPQISRW